MRILNVASSHSVIIYTLIYIFLGLKMLMCQTLSEQRIPQQSVPRISAPMVLVEEGQLRGMVNTNWKGGKFFSFLSIPYAQKPIRGLRFKDPWPPDKWNGIRDATVDMPRCLQHNIDLKIVGKEDCLYLNVHTLRLTGNAPVMVFIHGGGYLGNTGSAEVLGPEFILTENVVLVTFNYRLGLFGFLNFDDPTAGVPGNAGLKDQLMALQWVQVNIDKFGGNPEKVTIFGQDVGATSVHFHMMSPLSQPLFRRAIALGGTALHSWAMGSKDTGLVVAKLLKYKDENLDLVVEKLQNTEIGRIMKIQESVSLLPFHHKNFIGPVVERRHNGTLFLSESPYVTLAKGAVKKCPFILGVTDKPSLLYEVIELRRTGMLTPLAKSQIIPYTLSVNEFTSQLIYDEIMEAYNMRSLRIGTAQYRQLVDDLFMNYFLYITLFRHMVIKHIKVYFYVFSASTKLNFFKFSTRQTAKVEGASHMDEIGYLFKNSKTPPNIHLLSTEGKCVRKLLRLLTNFVKNGNPTPRRNKLNFVWKPVKKRALRYMHFHTNFTKMKVNPFRRMQLWNSIYSRFSSQCIHDYVFSDYNSITRQRLHIIPNLNNRKETMGLTKQKYNTNNESLIVQYETGFDDKSYDLDEVEYDKSFESYDTNHKYEFKLITDTRVDSLTNYENIDEVNEEEYPNGRAAEHTTEEVLTEESSEEYSTTLPDPTSF